MCLCRVGLGVILILLKALWFRFRLGSIEGWLFVYLRLVQDLFSIFRVGFRVGIQICVGAVQSLFGVDSGCIWDWLVVGVGVM